jgi:hypothetical protein
MAKIQMEKIGEIEITMEEQNGKTNYLNLLSKAHENGMKFFLLMGKFIVCFTTQ